MDNQQFLQSIGVPASGTQECLDAMAKYGDNKWWEPDVDPRKYAYYQIHEEFLLSNDFDHLKEALELLLGRPVFLHELNTQKLMQEADRAWKYQVGVTSEAEKQERLSEAIDGFAGWVEDMQKPEE